MRQTQNRNRKHKGKGTSQHFNGSNVQGLIAYPNPLQAGAPKLPWRRGWGLDTLPPGPKSLQHKTTKGVRKLAKNHFETIPVSFFSVNIEVTRGHRRSNSA